MASYLSNVCVAGVIGEPLLDSLDYFDDFGEGFHDFVPDEEDVKITVKVEPGKEGSEVLQSIKTEYPEVNIKLEPFDDLEMFKQEEEEADSEEDQMLSFRRRPVRKRKKLKVSRC